MRGTRHGCVVLASICSWVLGGCGVDSPETITGPPEKESGWVISSAQLLHPDGLRGGGAAYVFERSTFQKVKPSEMSPDSLYILGLVHADGKVFWEEAFEPEGESLCLMPWTPPKGPAAKPAAAVLRGDFDGSGRVDQTDVIFLFAWLAAQVEFPNTQMEAGDIDDDGDTDWQDLALLGAYTYADPRPRTNPHGIGQPLAEPLSARLEPDPTTVDWSQHGVWHRFVVRLEGGKGTEFVRVRVNPAGDDRLFSMSTWRQSSCFTGTNSTVGRRNGNEVYIAACNYGKSVIFVEHYTNERFTDERGNKMWAWSALAIYEIERAAPPPKPEATEFNIDLVFLDRTQFTSREREQIQLAADRWESIITGDIEDFSFVNRPYSRYDNLLQTTLEVQDLVDDIRIFVGTFNEPQGSVLARGGARWVRGDSDLPILGIIAFNEARFNRINSLSGWYGISLHEIAHALGFYDWFWEPEQHDLIRFPSENNAGADAHFIGPRAIAAFNRAGGWNYQGNKVPLENRESSSGRDSHWREFVFQNEVMDTSAGIGEYLSEITIAAFEDMGYEVDYTQADVYRLPRQASKPVAGHERHESWCEIIHPEGIAH